MKGGNPAALATLCLVAAACASDVKRGSAPVAGGPPGAHCRFDVTLVDDSGRASLGSVAVGARPQSSWHDAYWSDGSGFDAPGSSPVTPPTQPYVHQRASAAPRDVSVRHMGHVDCAEPWIVASAPGLSSRTLRVPALKPDHTARLPHTVVLKKQEVFHGRVLVDGAPSSPATVDGVPTDENGWFDIALAHENHNLALVQALGAVPLLVGNIDGASAPEVVQLERRTETSNSEIDVFGVGISLSVSIGSTGRHEVAEVFPGGPADGLLLPGDAILEVDGIPAGSVRSVATLLLGWREDVVVVKAKWSVLPARMVRLQRRRIRVDAKRDLGRFGAMQSLLSQAARA